MIQCQNFLMIIMVITVNMIMTIMVNNLDKEKVDRGDGEVASNILCKKSFNRNVMLCNVM